MLHRQIQIFQLRLFDFRLVCRGGSRTAPTRHMNEGVQKMKTYYCFSLILTVICFAAIQANAEITSDMFKHHYITKDLPGEKKWGYGTPVTGDFDKDGDLDFAYCNRMDKIYWFENKGAENWKQHSAGEIQTVQLGSTVLDVDGDSWDDIIIGGDWYRNPQNPRESEFRRYTYDPEIDAEIHDMVTADIDGDNKLDVVALGDREGCFWYRIPVNPKEKWDKITITMAVLNDNDDIHGGFFPNGVEDLDNDGDPDVVMPDRWYENQSSGKEWAKHPFPFGKRGPWGLSSRSWIVDLDKDGDNDIVIVDCDQKDSRAAWLEHNGENPPTFTAHFLPKKAEGTRGSFHSLAVMDFDGDGDLDIFTADQEDTSIFPSGANPRWYIWENTDGELAFTERVILDAKLGGHDVRVGDADGDGDFDLFSKVWNVWPGNANQGREHADYLENLSYE